MTLVEKSIQVCDFEWSRDLYDSIFKNLEYLDECEDEYIDIVVPKDLAMNILIDLYLECDIEVNSICIDSCYDGEYIITISKKRELYIEKAWVNGTKLLYSEPKIRYMYESCNYKILTENPNKTTTVIFGLNEIQVN